jgi:hypothetical protein
MVKRSIACSAANFMQGRPPGMRPEAIVLHRTGGTAEEIRVRFLDPTTAISAHYVVAKDGGVTQYVGEQDTAFHAGVVINPTWKRVKPNVNPNFYTIGIELEGAPDELISDEQLESCAALTAEVAARCEIPIDEDHLVLHSEIRASRSCPGAGFDRGQFVQRALLASSSARIFPKAGDVEILRDTNVREGLPSASARIVSVLRSGAPVRVSGFTLQGEAVSGSTAWYQTAEGNFFWAGNSTVPEPRPETEREEPDGVAWRLSATPEAAVVPPVIVPVVSCQVGITEIDQLFADPSHPPLELAKCSREVVGAIQDLLAGQGFARQPSVLSPAYGSFGDATQKALSEFQVTCGAPSNAVLTSEMMKQLIGVPAKDPRATRAYFSLALGIPFKGIHRVLAFTAQMEGVGRFAALNLNTDSAGLSFGLIQWAQRPGRLCDIVACFRDADRETFVRIFGAGDAGIADRLIAHLKKPSGGVDEKTGITTDPEFDLITPPWTERFREAALHTEYQRVQVNKAQQAFETSLERIRLYDTARLVQSERAVAFMLDVANQFGDGKAQLPVSVPDRGLAGIYRRVIRQRMTEQDLLQAVADATVAAMPARFQPGVRARRSLFLTTPLLSGTDEFTAL